MSNISKHTNIFLDGEVAGYNPDADGDYFKVVDYGRDFTYLQEKIAFAIRGLMGQGDKDYIILYGGEVTDSGSGQVDISEGLAIGMDANSNVRFVPIPALTNVPVPSGWNDGRQIWVIGEHLFKLSTDTRDHKQTVTSYHYTVEDSYTGETDSDDLFTDSDPSSGGETIVVWGSFTMTGTTFASLDTGERSSSYFNRKLAIGISEVKGTAGIVHIANGTNADTSWHGSAVLVVERNDDAFINIRTPNNKIGGLMISDPNATYSGELVYRHSDACWDIYPANGTTIARFNSTGLYIGGGANPSNPLHIQSTTTPQMRIAYDADSYWTCQVANGGNLTLTAGEVTGKIIIIPGTSNNYFDITTGAILNIKSSDDGEQLRLYHDGSNGHLGTAGMVAGNVIIDNTTESTTKDTGALIVEGGVGVEENVVAGGYIQAYGRLYAGAGRWPTGYLHGNSITEDAVFDAIAPAIPNTNDEIIVSGGFTVSGTKYVASYAIRTSSTRITMYLDAATENFDDGGATVYTTLSLSW